MMNLIDPTLTSPAVTLPMTGAEYLESLRDGREVWLNGEKVKDVTTHPAFRNAAASYARLYDALHDEALQDKLTTIDRYGHRTMKFFAPSYSAQELLEARDAIAIWARMSYGFQGRSPDYKAAFMATLGAAPEFYAPYQDNALAWYNRYAEKCLFLNHVIVDPPVDRNKPLSQTRDVYVHVTKETKDGVYISGAKMMGTGSALTHGTFVAQNNASAARMEDGQTDDFALVCFVPVSAKGQKIVCRTPYEQRAASPFDAPISSRYDENDAVLIFDDVFVPWEDVLIYKDVQKARAFYPTSGFTNRYTLQAQTRLAVKMDFMCGLLVKATEANGTHEFRGVQASVGEVFAARSILWAITSAMALDPQDGLGGMKIPKLEYATASRFYASTLWSKIREIFDTVLGGAPLVVPSSYQDLKNPELRPLIDRYYRGTGIDAEERIKLFKLVWDVTNSEFGGRTALYERNYGGNNDQVRMDNLNFTTRLGKTQQFRDMVDACMSDYTLDGWTSPVWHWKPQEK